MYAISEFEEWASNPNSTDMVSNSLEFLCNISVDVNRKKEISRLDYYQKVGNDWHTLNVYDNKVIVSFNAYHEDTYIIDTTQFKTSEITEEEYFQYCTIQDHLHLTEAEFRAIVRISKYVEDYNANSRFRNH